MQQGKKGLSPFSKALILFFLVVAVLYGVLLKVSAILGDEEAHSGKDRLAVIKVEGVIAESEEVIRQIKKFGDDNSVKGVLIRVNSPGGPVGPSQEIYREILRLKKKKKVAISMGSLAASGGYYIACGADRIFANPGTITGSIGIIMAFSNMEKLMDTVGLKTTIIKSGKHKDIGSPNREVTAEERKLLQDVSDDIHRQFIEAVAQGRNLPVEEVRKIATGRIFTGSQAKTLGLIDRLGNREDAIDDLARMVGIEGKPEIVEEKKDKNLLVRLITSQVEQVVSSLLEKGTVGGAYYLAR